MGLMAVRGQMFAGQFSLSIFASEKINFRKRSASLFALAQAPGASKRAAQRSSSLPSFLLELSMLS
jgi:hypothetical protein